MLETLKHFLSHPHENGITIFVLGILFVLSTYHFLLYFQNKNKVYLFYSLYTFLIFINQIEYVALDPALVSEGQKRLLTISNVVIIWVYNLIYFIFAFTFLNLKLHSKKWYSFYYKSISVLFFSIALITITTLTTGNESLLRTANQIIVPIIILLGIIAYYVLFTIDFPLKKYIIIGSLILFVSSIVSFYFPLIFNTAPTNKLSASVFYTGVIIENIIFSLGLGAKQNLILEEKNESQHKLILQLKENEKLKNTIQLQLEKDVALLNEQSKNHHLEKLKAKSDKEIAELKILSLRNQMNPHFIFNSLNSIKLYIIENEKENAVYYLNKFSKLIRKILATTKEKEISLADEIDTLKLYIDIENIRFNNQIETSFTIDEKLSLDTIKMPSLIFQPFIENAIWHGLSSKKGLKKIAIVLEKEKNSHVKISISDNGIGRKKSTQLKANKIHKKKSVGIQLTKERLTNFEKKFKGNYSLNFIDLYDALNNPAGTTVVLKIPVNHIPLP